MRYFFDTEFLEDGRTIDLISIGIVAEDGREYYAINYDFDFRRLIDNKWMEQYVIPHLPVEIIREGEKPSVHLRLNKDWQTRTKIASEIARFVDNKPEFWAWYADYDWVVLCQLFGTTMQLPNHFPVYCRDLKQLVDMYEVKVPHQEDEQHHALADARWVKSSFNHVMTKLHGRLPGGL